MNRISKSVAIVSLAAAAVLPVANDAQAWWGGPGWGPYYGGYPYYGGPWGGNPYYGGYYPYWGRPWGGGPWRRWWW